MEMVLFIGIQATGKSAYYSEKFYRTHVRINGDMLETRHREDLLIRACLEGKTRFCRWAGGDAPTPPLSQSPPVGNNQGTNPQ